MVNWHSPEELSVDLRIFNDLSNVILGLYLWEVIVSLDFEWQLIKGKRTFKWPLCLYFALRYGLLLNLLVADVSLNARKTNVACQPLDTIADVSAGFAVGMVSANLALRTIAIWSLNKLVICMLSIGPLVQISLGLYLGITSRSTWIRDVGCVPDLTDNTIVSVIFIYTMTADFVMLLLNLWKIPWKTFPGVKRGAVADRIFRDGLAYFIIAVTANIVAATFVLLRLNNAMTVMFDAPATTISTIAACRAVRRLQAVLGDGYIRGGKMRSIEAPRTSASRGIREPNVCSSIHIQMGTFGTDRTTQSKPQELGERYAGESEC